MVLHYSLKLESANIYYLAFYKKKKKNRIEGHMFSVAMIQLRCGAAAISNTKQMGTAASQKTTYNIRQWANPQFTHAGL